MGNIKRENQRKEGGAAYLLCCVSLQLCLTLCDPMNSTRILEWVTIFRNGKEMRIERTNTEGK